MKSSRREGFSRREPYGPPGARPAWRRDAPRMDGGSVVVSGAARQAAFERTRLDAESGETGDFLKTRAPGRAPIVSAVSQMRALTTAAGPGAA
jgi:hypothetical protein